MRLRIEDIKISIRILKASKLHTHYAGLNSDCEIENCID